MTEFSELLEERVQQMKEETRVALQLLFDNVNKGQKKQIVKDPVIRTLFDRYGVKYEG